jgi:F-type H+-transporting ATPase subunit b
MNIDWFTLVAQIINFALLVFLLNHFLYGPITRAMAKRESGIAARLEAAEQQERDAQLEMDRYRNLSNELEHQREVLFEQARAESEETRKSLIDDARTEIQSRRVDWQESLRREQEALIKLVRQRASQQVIAASRGALAELADADLEEQTMATFLTRLDELPQNQIDELKSEAQENDHAKVLTAFEISPAWQTRIHETLSERFSLKQISFVAAPDLVCGIELHVGGCKIGWSMQEYLESLSDELQGLLRSEV